MFSETIVPKRFKLPGLSDTRHYGLFTLPDSESDSDSKPKGYIVLGRNFHIGSDLDPDPYSDLHPNVTTFKPGDQSPNLNQLEISA